MVLEEMFINRQAEDLARGGQDVAVFGVCILGRICYTREGYGWGVNGEGKV